jgi:CheY-like chemotaxis protein
MPFRVREVLLVSSPYEAFMLEEDGPLTERIFTHYSELNLTASPRITHASSAVDALERLRNRRFDLVITMPRLADMRLTRFSRQLKLLEPRMPLAVLAFTEAELDLLAGQLEPGLVDGVFLWTGDSRILLAIVKLVEDRLNVEHDTECGGVQVILVVEDSIRRYSSFLSLLYAELMTQSQSLYAEGLNEMHRLMRMRARPKIVLARTFEAAVSSFESYRDYILGVITDVSFPLGGREIADAGFRLVDFIREDTPNIPVLMQSAAPENAPRAEALGVLFVDKSSDILLRRLRDFLKESLGFGPFVFRLPDRTEVARAGDAYEMEEVLATVPAKSLAFHARSHHFSRWLTARSMFGLARHIRPRRIHDFDNLERMREHLIGVLRAARIQEQEGAITDFSSAQTRPESKFVRVGSGSIGGKARGIAFANALLARSGLYDRFEGLRINIPKTVVIGTDEFDSFLDDNPHIEEVQRLEDDREIVARFLEADLSPDLLDRLRIACQDLRSPLAVRSSSLLEDSRFQPFAGIYATYMLPNNHPVPAVRLGELSRAIKAVYASTYCGDARAYMRSTPYRVEEEKMGVVIQRLVGRAHGDRFYPHMSGVALSYNYYPLGYQKAEEGVALMALGLGQIIVLGGSVLQFSPSTPQILPQFPSAGDFLKYSQKRFLSLDLARPKVDFLAGPEASLTFEGLEKAEADGVLGTVGSVYLPQEDLIRDNLRVAGPRMVTFNNILKWNTIPLAPALAELLSTVREGMGCAVEIEFAVDMGDFGQASGQRRRTPCLNVLQIRPQVQQILQNEIQTEGFPEAQVLCHTHRSLGHGVIEEIRDVVYVKRADLSSTETPAVAAEVESINRRLRQDGAPFVLIGPGRWGTSDPSLGIPVRWRQIAGARIIVETPMAGRSIEPSQGTHFFHNVISFRIGYLTLRGARLDRHWLDALPASAETANVRHVRLELPLRVHLDGRQGRAVILKPSPPDAEGL